jgi:hypothetical protein
VNNYFASLEGGAVEAEPGAEVAPAEAAAEEVPAVAEGEAAATENQEPQPESGAAHETSE